MNPAQPTTTPELDIRDKAIWRKIIAEYQHPSTARALWQVANTFIPYVLLWYFMYLSLRVSWFPWGLLHFLGGMISRGTG